MSAEATLIREGLRLLLAALLPFALAASLSSLITYALSRATGYHEGLLTPLARALSALIVLSLTGPQVFEALRRFAARAWGAM
ncbi:hypothetical protein KKF91_18265 [Myxococcota bacterium]|nr:hypothetical protein [Myxococcota bacterium]MBU1432488.1 hypothetical protein [Myxococcota bacterium]MBU1899648.1 hypothetical protein [Myxococcota bacterium]